MSELTTEDILDIEGIVIRKIPKQTVSRWTYREGDEDHLKQGERVITSGDRKMLEKTKQNPLAGYIVTISLGQDSIVRFDLKTCGTGKTIVEAYINMMRKGA